MIFIGILVAWAVLNTITLPRYSEAFDPYPYVFLNLILSMVAALQAPIILMSQNRQAMRDRLAAGLDYEVNLKAEIEIMALHEKLDQIRVGHLEELVKELQEKYVWRQNRSKGSGAEALLIPPAILRVLYETRFWRLCFYVGRRGTGAASFALGTIGSIPPRCIGRTIGAVRSAGRICARPSYRAHR